MGRSLVERLPVEFSLPASHFRRSPTRFTMLILPTVVMCAGVDPEYRNLCCSSLPVDGRDRSGGQVRLNQGTIAVRPDGQELAVACVPTEFAFSISVPTLSGIDPPAAPENLTASDSTTSAHVALSWDAVAGAGDYLIYRHTANDSAAASLLDTVSTNSFEDDSSEPGTTYFYWVRASNAGGSSDFSASDAGTRKIPTTGPAIDSQPVDRSVTYGGFLLLSVSATPVYGPASYQWYRGTAGDTSQPVGTNSSTLSLGDQTENASYWVRVFDNYGNSTDTVAAIATVVPERPARAFPTRGLFIDRVRLVWDAAAGASHYQVYRNTISSIDTATEIASMVNGTLFNDTTALMGESYYYWIRAIDGDGDVSDFRWANSGFKADAPLDGTFLPVYDRKDFVYSPDGMKLYVSLESGMLEVYDRVNPRVEKTYPIGGELCGIDVSPDGTVLLASQLRQLASPMQGQVIEVDLAGTGWSGHAYDLEFGEGGSRDVVLYSNTRALVNTQYNGSGWTPLRTLDLDTGLYSEHPTIRGHSFFARTTDRSKVVIFEGNSSAGEWFFYDALGDTFGAKNRANGSLRSGAVSPDGLLVALRVYPQTRIYSAAGSLLQTLVGNGGVAFSPHKAQVYTVDPTSDEIRGYSTVNWAQQFALAIPGGVDIGQVFDDAWLKVSPNGEELAVATDDGIRFLDISALLPPNPPVAPASITASDDSNTDGVLVSWSASAGAADYSVFRHTSDDSAGASLIASGVSATSYLDATASVGVSYYYWVKAGNLGGTSGFSPSDVGVRKMGTPGSITASDGTSSSSVEVSWASAGAGATYEVFSNGTDDLGSATLLSTVSTLSITDTTPPQGVLRYYWVRARAGSSTGEFTDSDSGFRGLPAPTGVGATTSLGSRVTITWNAVPGATEYEVHFGTSSSWSSIQRLVGTTSDTTIDDSAGNFAARTDYYWFVRAGVNGVFSSWSNGVVGSRLIAPPANVVASTGEINVIRLSWNLNSDPRSGQRIYRSKTNDFSSAVVIATPDASVSQYTDTDTLPQTNYYYWVQSHFLGADGEPSVAVLGRRIGGEFSDFAELYDLEPEESVLSADLDYDGQNTFAEWTLGGTDPGDPSSTPSFVMEVRSIDGGQYLTLCFLRLAGGTEAGDRYTVANVVYECQGTGRLGRWDSQPVLTETPAGLPEPPTSYEWGCVRLPYEVSENPNGYLRILVYEQN